MSRQSVFEMPFEKVYQCLVQKAERKGRTQAEVDQVIRWLTGYESTDTLAGMTYGGFLSSAPAWNSRAGLITGTVCGIRLPEGLQECDKLPEPIYTPSTKAEIGDHDENISFERSIEVLEKAFPGHGREYAETIRDCTIALYKKCADYALTRGIIIADTKFEFGLDENGNVVLGDEMLTPDSSRFWPLEGYEPGHGQPSFDKQFVRDWLKANPDSDYLLPRDVIDKTIDKYKEAYHLLTGDTIA